MSIIGRGPRVSSACFSSVPEIALRHVTRTMLKPQLVSFTWDPVECEQRLGETVGYLYEVRNFRDRSILVRQMVNDTKVTVEKLVPFTKYVFQIKFVNHVGEGPFSDPQELITLQGRKY